LALTDFPYLCWRVTTVNETLVQQSAGARTEKTPTRVAVLSQQALMGQLLRRALARHDGIDVVVESAVPESDETFEQLILADPEVVLLGAEREDNLELVRRIADRLPDARVIVLSGLSDASLSARAFEAGATGFLALRLPLNMLVNLIAGDHRQVRAATAASAAAYRRPPETRDRLTDRELEVLRRVAIGESTNTIAAELGVTVATVRTHTQSVLTKLGLHSKVEAAAYAVRNNLT
jgi:DNA-binding NarL/FixJ family response regulator